MKGNMETTTTRAPLVVHDNAVYEWFTSTMFEGYLPQMPALPEASPVITWKGGLISWDLYCKLVSFFKWSYDTTKGEAQARLVYHPTLRQWDVVVLPQEMSHGLSSRELTTHADRQEAQAIMEQGYITCGTAHHHCGCGAFQSGTDSTDEIRQDGLHITFGKLDADELDIHARLTIRGQQYNTKLIDWVSLPAVSALVPACFVLNVQEYYLTHPLTVAFDPVWKTRLIVPEVKNNTTLFQEAHRRKLIDTGERMPPPEQITGEELIDWASYSSVAVLTLAEDLVNACMTLEEAEKDARLIARLVPALWAAQEGVSKINTYTGLPVDANDISQAGFRCHDDSYCG
jgi:hypothetical protein